MTLRRILLLLAAAGALAAQTFVQMTDPQFGMFTDNKSFDHETANFEFAVAAANRIRPAFVIVTGDLVNRAGDAAEIAEYKRIAAKLAPPVRLFNIPGNHDVGNEPTPDSLAEYRAQFGPDYYAFREGDIAGFVLDSCLERNVPAVADEAAKMEAWLKTELAKARQDGVKSLIVFQHHPFFLKDPQEPDVYENVPRPVRRRYLALLHEFGVRYVFAGHTHKNYDAADGDLHVIVSAPVGKPLGGAQSGLRVVTVTPGGLSQKYYDFGDLP
ncbi:MAG: metallophosphoesterase [Acidobacteriia bacterium]|nr:metallophosphoesterase [Terriglobia bacterium]